MCLSLLNLISSDLKDFCLVYSFWPSCRNGKFYGNLVFGWAEWSDAFLLFAAMPHAMPHVQGQKHNQGLFFFSPPSVHPTEQRSPARQRNLVSSPQRGAVGSLFLAARCAVSNADPRCMLRTWWPRAWLHSVETSSRATSILQRICFNHDGFYGFFFPVSISIWSTD